jgi:hypothetical protein
MGKSDSKLKDKIHGQSRQCLPSDLVNLELGPKTSQNRDGGS